MIEVESEILDEAIDCNDYHKYAPKYGHRAWIAIGEEINVVYWDSGNGWCLILDVIPKDKKQETVIRFYKKLRKLINENYDESGYRINEEVS